MPLLDFHTHRPTAEGVTTPRCFGIHPWRCGETEPSQFSTLYPQFEDAEIVGECGLDKCCETPWDVQMDYFVRQIEIAEQLNKPLVIHCVRAFNELMELRKKYHRTPWVVHGFTGSTELFNQLLHADIEVSFGDAILDKRRSKVRETISKADPHRIFLETDDSGADISDIYKEAADLMGCDPATLQDAIKSHYEALLKR